MGKLVTLATIKGEFDNRKTEVDKSGYHLLILGAVNVYNSAGEYYLGEGIEQILGGGDVVLSRRAKSGSLKGEQGHPKWLKGMTKDEFFARNATILESNTCAHFKNVYAEQTDIDSGFMGRKVILIRGWVKGAGVGGVGLDRDLNNPEVNVAFSVRSFTKPGMLNGVKTKRIVQLVTWDHVLEPGIEYATKWKTIGIETREIGTMDYDDMFEMGTENLNQCFNCGLESKDQLELFKEIRVNYDDTSTKAIIDW